MISAHGIAIASALSDWFGFRVDFDGQDFVWPRKHGSKQVHPANALLKSVVLGKIEVVN